MSITGKIKTLFSDKNKTEVLFPRTKVSAVSDDNGVGLNVLLEQTVPMTRGGTGAENGAEGLANMFAAGGTVLSPYQYGNELPANAAVGQVYFEEATGTIADIGQDVAKALRAVNLLDNSDFRNPVNQRGATSYSGTGYTIDRWKLTDYNSASTPTLTVKSGYIEVNPDADLARLYQNLENYEQLKGKKCTIALNVDGEVYSAVFTIGDAQGDHTVTLTDNINLCSVDNMNIILDITAVKKLYWVALYEGEYTLETLPPYVPKCYGAELAECKRYYQQSFTGNSAKTYYGCVIGFGANTNWIQSVHFEVGMRNVPTVTFYNYATGESGSIARWADDATISGVEPKSITTKGFIPSKTGGITTNTSYGIHYTASADL